MCRIDPKYSDSVYRSSTQLSQDISTRVVFVHDEKCGCTTSWLLHINHINTVHQLTLFGCWLLSCLGINGIVYELVSLLLLIYPLCYGLFGWTSL